MTAFAVEGAAASTVEHTAASKALVVASAAG